MKKFKYIIALFFIFVCNHTFAGEVDLGTGKIITDDNYLRYDNGVFLGKKQIDEEKGNKVRGGSELIELYKNDNIDFLTNVSTNSRYYYGYNISEFYYENSYYSIKTNINSNITRITDFEGNNLTFSGTGGDIKIYNISFFDYLRNDDTNSRYYNFKYGNNYSYNAKPINIFFENGDNLSLDFKFNIPQISSNNEIYTFSGVNYITNNDGYNIKSDVLFDGNIYFGGIENTLSQDGKNINFNMDFTGSLLFNNNINLNGQNTYINLFSYNNYDYFKYNYGIINIDSSLCGKTYFAKTYIVNGEPNIYIDRNLGNNESYTENELDIYDFNFELQKFNGNNYNNYTTYNSTKDFKQTDVIEKISGIEDGIYKIKNKNISGNIRYSEVINDYCNIKFNKPNIITTINDINNVIVKNGNFYLINDLYFINYNEFNLYYYTLYKDIINDISLNIYSSTGNLIYSANNDIFKIYDQYNRYDFENIVNNILNNNTGETIEIKYNFFENQKYYVYKNTFSTKNNEESSYTTNDDDFYLSFNNLKNYLLYDDFDTESENKNFIEKNLILELVTKNGEKINIPFGEIEYDEEGNQIQKYVNFYNNVGKNEYYYDGYFNIHLDSKYKNNIYKINIYYNKNGINELEKVIYFDKISFFSESLDKIINVFSLKSKNGIFGRSSITHSFDKNINDVLISRKINYSGKTSTYNLNLSIDLGITGDNIGTVDNSKIYICKEKKYNINDILNDSDCNNYYYDNSLYETNEIYLYFTKGSINENYNNINIDFTIKSIYNN